jgi:hypothetical protein
MPTPNVTNPNMFAQWKAKTLNNILELCGGGAPTNGTTGKNIAGPGSTYTDYTNGVVYVMIGTILFPVWQAAGGAGTGTTYTKRTRNTIAEVNAGATLLPAIPGWKYRMLDMTMTAIGGAVAATTTVDILGTQATVSVKLLSVAIAALTQSALVRAGATNATILANGASFMENDVNTPITIGKTGATATTATHVDTVLTYELIKA